MKKTTNFSLNKPEPTDPLRAADFNENADRIDAALGERPVERVYAGSYVGDGMDTRTIQLPWEPKFAFMLGMASSSYAPIIMTQEDNFYISGTLRNQNLSSNTWLVGDTFQIRSKNFNNQAGETMYYFLFR